MNRRRICKWCKRPDADPSTGFCSGSHYVAWLDARAAKRKARQATGPKP